MWQPYVETVHAWHLAGRETQARWYACVEQVLSKDGLCSTRRRGEVEAMLRRKWQTLDNFMPKPDVGLAFAAVHLLVCAFVIPTDQKLNINPT